MLAALTAVTRNSCRRVLGTNRCFVLLGISDWSFMIFLRRLWKIVAINES